jgi:hypothetical protein
MQFRELSGGKGYIKEKDLRKWDELKEVVQAGLVPSEVLESYFDKINIEDGKIYLPAFKEFMNLIDTVLIDDDGNILGF